MVSSSVIRAEPKDRRSPATRERPDNESRRHESRHHRSNESNNKHGEKESSSQHKNGKFSVITDYPVIDKDHSKGTSKSGSQKTSSPSRRRRRRRSSTSSEEWVESRPEPSPDSSPSTSKKRDHKEKDDNLKPRPLSTAQPIHTSQQPAIASAKSKWDDENEEENMVTDSPQVPEDSKVQSVS